MDKETSVFLSFKLIIMPQMKLFTQIKCLDLATIADTILNEEDNIAFTARIVKEVDGKHIFVEILDKEKVDET